MTKLFIPFALILSLFIASPTKAANFSITDEATLIAAVNTANGNGEADVIDLGGNTIQLSTFNASSFGDIGLPTITSEITFRNGTISRNSTDDFRIMRVSSTGNVTLDNIVIENGLLLNGTDDGGGIVNDGTLVIRNSIIRNNTAARGGGAIYNGDSLTIVNSLIVGNSAGGSGGAIINFGTSLNIINSTIANNTASGVTGGVLFEPFNISNSIIWGNSGIDLSASNSPTDPFSANYSIVQGGFAGTGNLNLDPLFVNSAGGDYSLSAFSPAIDSADASLLPGGTTLDLAGNTRQVNDLGLANTPSILDRGAYEFQATSSYTASITANDNAAAENPANNGQFTVSLTQPNRSGNAITLNYNIAGTATNGTDYNTLTGSVTIAANQQSAIINVVPINDDFAEAIETVSLTLTSSNAPTIVIIDNSPATVNITSDDTAGFLIIPNSLTISEASGTDSFTVQLTSEPVNDVTVSLTPNDNSICTIDTSSLTFTSANWDTAQTVTVTGINDNIVNAGGNRSCTVTTDPASSSDADYNGLNPSDISVTVVDDDVAGFTLNPTSLIVSEPNISDSFEIQLNTVPSSPVTVLLSSSDPSACAVSPSSVILSDQTASLVTVTAVDDFMINPGGQRSCSIITAPASSPDVDYNGLDASDVNISVLDNEVSGSDSIRVEPLDLNLMVNGSGSYSIVLLSQPGSTVEVTAYPTHSCYGFPGTLSFDASNWNIPQTMFIVSNAPGECTVIHQVNSADSNFDGLSIANVNVNVSGEIQIFDPAISKLGFLVPGQVGITGEQLEWVTTVSNTGTAAGTNVTIVDNVDSRLQVNSVNAPNATVEVNGNQVNVTYAVINPGETFQFSIFTTVLQGETVNNTICIAGTDTCATGSAVGSLPATGESRWWRRWTPNFR